MKKLLCYIGCVAQLLVFVFTAQCVMKKNAKIYVAGHTGLVGCALVKLLKEEGFSQVVMRSSAQLDLRNQNAVQQFMGNTGFG